ncbi:DNA-directed DNA polymerase [Tanacetum coccineum]
MTPTKGIKAIKELSEHSLSWYMEGNIKAKNEELQIVLKQINNFENNMNIITEEVRMEQHRYKTPMEERISNLEEALNSFFKESLIRQKESENMVWGIKKSNDQAFKTQASSIKKIQYHLGKIAEIIQDREARKLPSSTETKPRGLAHAITTRSELNYKPPKTPLKNNTNSQEKPVTNETITRDEEEDLFVKKGEAEEMFKITLNERCFAVLLNKIPPMEKDPGNFTIPCVIGKFEIDKALANLGASISLMSYSMFDRLNLGELKPTLMCIKLANKSTQYPQAITENVIVKIDKFIFLFDFVVLDMEEDHKISIILRRPFLATAHAMLDVFNKKISFKVGNETITFDIEKSMKVSTPEDDTCLSIDMVDVTVLDNVQEILPSDPLDSFLFELVLSKHKADLAWKVADIKGISQSFCTYKILMEDDFKAVVQPQRRLNPKVQDVVKLFDVGLIYAISDSPWAFNILKDKLTTAPIIVAPNWNLDFELMCDAGDYVRTAYKSLIESTPFRIVYGKACHLPIEMEHKAYWALKNVNLNLDAVGKHRFSQQEIEFEVTNNS